MEQNPLIKARLENEIGEEFVEFHATSVMAYHLPESNKTWNELSHHEQMSMAEDYALWAFKRKFGDDSTYRVDIVGNEFP